MDLNTLETMLIAAYDHLTDKQGEFFLIAEKTLTAKRTLEDERAQGLSTGTISGKNTDEREASARLFLEADYIALDTCQREERQAKVELDYARTNLDMYRDLLRIAEIAHGVRV